MNKLLLVLSFATLVIGGCQKKIADTIDGQTPDQRLSVAMAAYQKDLTQSPNGWILVESTTGTAFNGGAPTQGAATVFAYYMQFNDSNQVTMFSDWDSSTALTPKTSSYRVKALQRPALIFDTYSYIHLPCDPDPNISKSPFGPGFGWGADFEYSFADNVDPTALGDTIHLLGNLNSANAIMIKATKAQHDAYFNGTFANDFIFNKIQNYFKDVTVGGKTYQITPGVGGRNIDISWLNGPGNLKTASTTFYQVADGIGFGTPIQANGQTLTGLQNIVYNAGTSTATAKINGASATVTGDIAPLLYDPNGPYNWYTSALSTFGLYLSPNGFHVDGVDDAFQLDTLSYNGLPYTSYIYFPGFFGSVDAFAPVFNFTTLADYSNGTAGGVDSLGIAYFNLYYSTTQTTPTPNAVTATNNIETDPNGFYIIMKENGTSFDQVITSDAKSWISWTYQP